MPNENSPLLPQSKSSQRVEYGVPMTTQTTIYDRFTPGRKRMILALVSLAGMIPLFVIGSFVPCIPQISRDLHSTGTVIKQQPPAVLTCLFIVLTEAILFAADGRRPVYLTVLPIFVGGSLGVSLARSAPQLMLFRVVQAFGGGGGGMSVGAGIISDIYRSEERGAAMGFFFAASLLGPSLSPIVGGLAASHASWRVLQLILGMCGAALFVAKLLFLPETSWPRARGIDKLREAGDAGDVRWSYLQNPFKHVSILQSPNVLLLIFIPYMTFYAMMGLTTDLTLLIPLSYTIGARYNIKNEVVIGALLLPGGLASALGAPIAGRVSDRVVVGWRKKRNGRWVPEDRLRAALPGAFVLLPLSVLLSGVFTHYVPGTTGLVLNAVCLFVSGIGVRNTPTAQSMWFLTPIAAYNVDILRGRSAEVFAVTSALRHCITALATATFLPLINCVGVLATDAIAAGVAWTMLTCVAGRLLWITIRYEERMRAWVDVGYSVEWEH
ncbi:major facilitator superfamily domain-containing protein [Russula earlei]|uniref:Major facilitator superfamily domain-containing protein n=1 Tax=Russula earlei TaxID=71964 RepID=A0ACC0TYJ9_9AGAM|nr:major facilitator superfamily domain-containing protein [Russula earlei]